MYLSKTEIKELQVFAVQGTSKNLEPQFLVTAQQEAPKFSNFPEKQRPCFNFDPDS